MFKILVVDNDLDTANSLKKCLIKLFCDVAIAETAKTGMEKIKTAHFDAVFASLCLHDISGRGLARWMKNLNGRTTKFFLTTGWKGEIERRMLGFDGISDVVRKPFSVHEVRDKLIEHLG